MKIRYKYRIIFYFLAIFIIYTVSIIWFEQKQEKQYKIQALESKLDAYTQIIHTYIDQNITTQEGNIKQIHKITDALPVEIRITIINNDGKVLFDKNLANIDHLENHLDRLEIKGALYQDYGTNIRRSVSTEQDYLYYAKHYQTYFVRVALPYDGHTQSLLQADDYFIYFTIILFVVVFILLYFAATRFNTNILQLKELTGSVKNGKALSKKLHFSDDELGDISKELINILEQKEKSKRDIEAEREKLRQHFQYSEEGLGVFDSNYKKRYVNTHFIQYLNLIVDYPILDVDTLFDDKAFSEIPSFLKNRKRGENNHSFQLKKNGKIFLVKIIIYDDNNFELTIKDITKIEKNRILKQEMTSNIAHELRTPVTALRGYLETLHEQDLSTDKQKQFVEKAHLQSIRLSELIEDVSLLSKIEEANSSFVFDKVDMSQLINNVRISLSDKLISNNITMLSTLKDDVLVTGNYTLLFSAIQNLVINSIKYGGTEIEIHIDNYLEDDKFYYFTYYDTGIGVDESHMNRLFERFYRINEGRTRNTGGSGLGLSIVRNAILLHKGEIQAKRHVSGGLEFLFKLSK